MTFPKSPIKLIVGLGNPGADYERTRHNAGFWFAEDVAHDIGGSFSSEKKFFGQIARGSGANSEVRALKPQMFMNLSGQSVAAAIRFYDIAPDAILVAHDELDLDAGEIKLKFGGGHAGHNGLRDIHAQLGTDDYWRLRLGVGHPGVKSEVINWVLKKPSLDHRIAIEQSIARALTALPHLLAGDMDKATMLVHTSKPPRPKLPRPETQAP